MARNVVETARRWISPSLGNLRIPFISDSASDGRTPPRSDNLARRYAPCRILDKKGIPNVIWFEDALSIYGGNSTSLNLYLLVPDESTASKVLLKSGYKEAPPTDQSPLDENAHRGGTRLEPPNGPFREKTVLIRAAEWNYDLQYRTMYDCGPLPPLDKFVTSLMTYWLDIPRGDGSGNLLWSMNVAMLIGNAYDLPNPSHDLLRSPAFAEKLHPEVRELHYDMIGTYPRKSDISSFRKHSYHFLRRQQIREGKFTPRPYPTNCFPVSMAEYPELTGMNVDLDIMPKKKGRKTKRRSVSFKVVSEKQVSGKANLL